MSKTKETLESVIEESDNGFIINDTKANDIDRLDFSDQFKERYQQNTKDRKWLAIWAACIVSLWLFAVISLLFCNTGSFKVELLFFTIDLSPKINDNVLNVLLATTTLNVLGLVLIVLQGHFKIGSDISNKKIDENSIN